MNSFRSGFSFLAPLISLGVGLSLAGCNSVGQPASSAFASVTIHNHSAEAVAFATSKVFRADGYKGGPTGSSSMVFEREASRMTTASRSGILATRAGATALNRVKVEMVDLGSGSWRIQCQAFVVSNPEDAFFANESPVGMLHRGPYQSLLDKVAKELK